MCNRTQHKGTAQAASDYNAQAFNKPDQSYDPCDSNLTSVPRQVLRAEHKHLASRASVALHSNTLGTVTVRTWLISDTSELPRPRMPSASWL